MVNQLSCLEDLDQVLQDAGDRPVLVDFFATWCGPCKMIAPELERFAEMYSSLLVYKVDIDEAEDIAGKYEIGALPSFIVFQNGEEIETIVGGNADKLEEVFKKYC